MEATISESNRGQIAYVREVTHGVTPTTPRMRLARITGEGLVSAPTYIDSEEIRADRMNADPAQNLIDNNGSINFEWSYPVPDTFLSDVIRTCMWSDWVNTPAFDNDGTADSVITDAGTTANTYAVTAGGASVVVGHLVRATGFTNAANNQIFRAASSTATTIVGTALSLTAETAPPATARLKVVGFQGASADITATATGLGATALNFTTLGLAVGQWVKVGGTAAGDRFTVTTANNNWARITAITATALTLDNRPSGWGVDAGTGKTIKVWVGDWIKNGVTRTSLSIERGYLGQTVPSYLLQKGMTGNTLQIVVQSRGKATGAISFMGLSNVDSTTAQDAIPDVTTTSRIIGANANFARINEAGAPLTNPNWAREFEINLNNNLRTVEDVTSLSPVEARSGSADVSVRLNDYFGDLTMRNKFTAGTVTSISGRFERDGQAIVWEVPRCTYRDGGNPNIAGKNQDVMLPLTASASMDALTSAHLIISRIEYFEL